MATIRQERVSRMLFEELSIMIGGELSDPDLSLVTVTDLLISRDLRNAKVFVFHDDETVTDAQVLRALNRAAPYMRGQIAERCGLRMVPDLSFSYDDTPERAERMDAIFAQLATENQDSTETSGTETSGSVEEEAEENSEIGAQSTTGSETGQ